MGRHPAPRPGLTDRVDMVARCTVCARARRTHRLDVRASFSARYGPRRVLELLPGARVCSTCLEGCTLYPSPAHVAPAATDAAALEREA